VSEERLYPRRRQRSQGTREHLIRVSLEHLGPVSWWVSVKLFNFNAVDAAFGPYFFFWRSFNSWGANLLISGDGMNLVGFDGERGGGLDGGGIGGGRGVGARKK